MFNNKTIAHFNLILSVLWKKIHCIVTIGWLIHIEIFTKSKFRSFALIFHFNFFLDRILWCVVHMIGAISVIVIINWVWDAHMLNPFVTTLYDTAYSISKIGYPGKFIELLIFFISVLNWLLLKKNQTLRCQHLPK